MASINKSIPSIANGSLEIAPALANLNFDFALWKVAAPKEFEGVGLALSTSRREEAEGGMLHTIARKLGALFKSRVPATPGLTKAYGTRASEVAQALSLDDRGRKRYGVFADRAGPDATSLWAAATSGTTAISVHLLACLLARIWDAPEAISIWVEVVKRRKEEVNAQFDETDIAHMATLSAARQDFPRAQIAEWDDSARAWLRIADKVKDKQQKQLMLILDNVEVPVNGNTDTYDSVMNAWTNSLVQMEALVQGISQQARTGEILLGLSSWHLYPDLTVVTTSMTHTSSNILGTPSEPLFGMLNKGRFVRMITNEEDKIVFLRKIGKAIAEQMRLDSSQILIRYKHRLSGSRSVYEYATAVPLTNASRKRKADNSNADGVRSYHRWLYSGASYGIPLEYVEKCCTRFSKSEEEVLSAIKPHVSYLAISEVDMTVSDEDFERRRVLLDTAGESVFKREDQLIGDNYSDVGIYWRNFGGSTHCSTPWYRFIYGAIDDAALFVTQEQNNEFIDVVMPAETNATKMYLLFETGKMDTLETARELEGCACHREVDGDAHLRSLKAISTAAKIYSHFPNASVDVRILQQRLYNARWIGEGIGSREGYTVWDKPRQTPKALQPYALGNRQAFACLAMFESGQYDIDPNQLADVMAMCSGDSIYFRAALLADPYEFIERGDIRGIIGNIGRPVIAFLVPPKAPLVKEASLDEWPLIEHHNFDGSFLDNFQNTSLHLSFTTAERPLNIGSLGGQDKVACILETLMSVYDGGRWIGDLNISNLDSVSTTKLSRMPRCTAEHPQAFGWRPKITCIDSWLGLINAPEEKVSLLRAHGNWQARLAASSISLALGHDMVILPDEVCLQCLHRFVSTRFGNVVAIG
ncbi:MAG: hypothetical protein LQ338_006389 [Usnochroma carphineum]|nr:MAG: hypothetical protein LQ338_006389 [Usnochroma carphineum]